jgi:hypothetical protein
MSALKELQINHTRSTADKLPQIHQSPLTEAVREFLREKEHFRKAVRSSQTALEKLLIQLKPKLFNFTIPNLLDEIDKWYESSKDRSQIEAEKWRMRSGIAQRFSDCLDQPQNLLKPSARS